MCASVIDEIKIIKIILFLFLFHSLSHIVYILFMFVRLSDLFAILG